MFSFIRRGILERKHKAIILFIFFFFQWKLHAEAQMHTQQQGFMKHKKLDSGGGE